MADRAQHLRLAREPAQQIVRIPVQERFQRHNGAGSTVEGLEYCAHRPRSERVADFEARVDTVARFPKVDHGPSPRSR
jgi:hypothetical protein